MRYLSEKKINVEKRFGTNNIIDLTKDVEALGWENFPCARATSPVGSRYYRFDLYAGKIVTFDKANAGEISRIEDGYFAGRYAFIEHERTGVNVTIVSDREMLRLPSTKVSNLVELDEMFSNENVQEVCIDLLHKFDLTRTVQEYQIFCDKLPKKCFEDGQFVNAVLNSLNDEDSIRIVQPIDRRFINLTECANETQTYFSKLVTKNRAKEKELVF